MSQVTKMLPAILPKVKIVKCSSIGETILTISELFDVAEIECRVTGPSTERKVCLMVGDQIEITREPGPMGMVSLTLPPSNDKTRAVLALGVLAYAVFDYVARESMKGHPLAKSALPHGRPRKVHPLSGAERQRRWRQRLSI